MTDLSGLDVTTHLYGAHTCDDATGWKSQNLAPGSVLFDLQATVQLEQLAIWNSGQSAGQRGVDAFTIHVSTDGNQFTQVGGTRHLALVASCPARAEFFAFPPVAARHVRLDITSSHNAGTVSNLGLGEVWFSGVSNCNGAPVAGVTATTDMGELTALASVTSGAGLSAADINATHDCGDPTGWKSTVGTTSGVVTFDLGSALTVRRLAVWNNGQLNGMRGVNGVTFSSSTDGVTFTPMANMPTSLALAPTCPVTPQVLPVSPPVNARFIRFNVTSGHGGGNTGLAEVMFFAE